jgi:hypothetical protein
MEQLNPSIVGFCSKLTIEVAKPIFKYTISVRGWEHERETSANAAKIK